MFRPAEWRVKGLADLGQDLTAAQAQFERGTRILGRSRVIDLGLVTAVCHHLDVPGDRVVRARPVCKVRAVRSTRAPLDVTMGHPVARRQPRDGKGAISHRERAVVVPQSWQQLLRPASYGLLELRGDFRPVFGDVFFLAGVHRHVIKPPGIVEAILLAAHAHLAVPVAKKLPVRPTRARISSQQRCDAYPVEGLGRDDGNPGQVGKRRQQVDRAGDRRDLRSGPDVAGPAHEQRSADPSFIGRALPPPHAAIPAPTVRAIIAEVEHDRVVRQLQLVETLEHTPHVPVDVLAHRHRGPREVDVLTLGPRITHAQIRIFELFEKRSGTCIGEWGVLNGR